MSYGNRNLRGSRPATTFHSYVTTSPLDLTNLDGNKGFDIDTTNGAFIVNLPSLDAVSSGTSFSFAYINGPNAVTINAVGGDELLYNGSGVFSVALSVSPNAIRLVSRREVTAAGSVFRYWALDGGQIL